MVRSASRAAAAGRLAKLLALDARGSSTIRTSRKTSSLGADTAATPIDCVPLTVEYSLTSLAGMGMTEWRTSFNWGNARPRLDERRVRAEACRSARELRLSAHRHHPHAEPAQGLSRASSVCPGRSPIEPLISNEGFSIGGLDSVRGYAESQALGDSGVRASIQLETPSLVRRRRAPGSTSCACSAFYDWGQVRIQDPLADVDGIVTERITLASAELGFRVRLFQKMQRRAAASPKPLHTKEERRFRRQRRPLPRASSACGPNSDFPHRPAPKAENHEEVDGADAPRPDDRAERGSGPGGTMTGASAPRSRSIRTHVSPTPTTELKRVPVLIRLHEGNFKFLDARSDGTDLRFVAADDKTPLNYHIEAFDGVASLAYIWVDVPVIEPGKPQDISAVLRQREGDERRERAGHVRRRDLADLSLQRDRRSARATRRPTATMP